MNKLARISVILAIIISAGFINTGSLNSAPAAETGNKTAKASVKKAVKPAGKVNETATETTGQNPAGDDTSGFHTNTGNLVTIGGGYFLPLGDMSDYLKPAWSVKLTYQDNQRGGSPIGFGGDLIYSYPHDKEVSGGLVVITAAPHISLIIPLFDSMDMQFKAGPGLTVLTSILETGKKASGDMTLHCGVNFSRVFAGAYYVGLGTDFYYIFERKNLRTLNTWFSMGYRW